MKKKTRKWPRNAAPQSAAKEIQRKISKTIVILIPLIAVIALFIAIAITSADSASDTDSDSAGYSTDASLTVEDGDTVNIDYVGSVDGVEFEGGSTQGQEQTLSSAQAAISMISKNSSSALIPEMKSMCTQPSPIHTITIPISAGKRHCLK